MTVSIRSPDIVCDESGTLREDVFYKVSTDNYLAWNYLPDSDKQGFTVVPPRTAIDSFVDGPYWLTAKAHRWHDSSRVDMLCVGKQTPTHQRQPFVEQLQGDLFGGPLVADFVIDVAIGWLLVTAEFAESLRATKFTGYDLQPFKVIVDQSLVPGIKLVHLQACGLNCERPPRTVRGKNRCPSCAKSPVFCDVCGHRWFTCPKCRSEMYVTSSQYQGPIDKRLLIQPISRNGGILDGRRWDGSDFISSHDHVYFSRRAFAWMTANHAGPLVGIPARFCVDGMNAANLERVAEITDLSTIAN